MKTMGPILTSLKTGEVHPSGHHTFANGAKLRGPSGPRHVYLVDVNWSIEDIHRRSPYFRLQFQNMKDRITFDCYVQLTSVFAVSNKNEHTDYRLELAELTNLELMEIIGNDKEFQQAFKR